MALKNQRFFRSPGFGEIKSPQRRFGEPLWGILLPQHDHMEGNGPGRKIIPGTWKNTTVKSIVTIKNQTWELETPQKDGGV